MFIKRHCYESEKANHVLREDIGNIKFRKDLRTGYIKSFYKSILKVKKNKPNKQK